MKSASRAQLFGASCTSLVVTAFAFAIRGGIMSDLGVLFHLTGTQLGWIAGAAFWGTALALAITGPLCDVIGIGRLLMAACVGHAAGILLTIFSTSFWPLFLSTALIGMANGLIEGAGNPLVAVLYRNEKAKWLNLFHAWYPAGVIIGGLVAYVLRRFGVGWQIQVATILIPTIAYGAMFWGREFPETERAASGVTGREMMAECLRPLFLFMAACMLFTATTEIATNQWIAMLLEHSGVPGILILVWVTGFMTGGRLGIGPVVRRIGITGILILASVVSAIGLYWMSYSSGYWTLPAAATYAIGVCYYWPTMLSFVAERLPKSGAMGLAGIGSAGMIAVAISLPVVGHIYDRKLLGLVSSGMTFQPLNAAVANSASSAEYASLQLAAGSATLRQMAILPCILIFAFTILLTQQRGKSTEVLIKVKAVPEEA